MLEGHIKNQFRFENRSLNLKKKEFRTAISSLDLTYSVRVFANIEAQVNENLYADSRTNGIKWLVLPFDRNETSDVLWTRSYGQRTGVEKSWNTHQLLQDFFVQKSFTASWKCVLHSYLSHRKLCYIRCWQTCLCRSSNIFQSGKFEKYFENEFFVLKNIIAR